MKSTIDHNEIQQENNETFLVCSGNANGDFKKTLILSNTYQFYDFMSITITPINSSGNSADIFFFNEIQAFQVDQGFYNPISYHIKGKSLSQLTLYIFQSPNLPPAAGTNINYNLLTNNQLSRSLDQVNSYCINIKFYKLK